MSETHESVLFLPGPSADQSVVQFKFRDSNGDRQTHTIPLLDALAVAGALEEMER